MQVTLRKAANVSKDLLRAASALRQQKQVSLSVHMDDTQALATLEAVATKNRENVSSAFALIEASYAIRRLIAAKNAELGIDGLLTEQAELTSKENVYSQAASSGSSYGNSTSRELALKVLASNRARLDNSNGYASEEISVSLVSDAEVEANKAEVVLLRRSKSEINDKLTALNSANFVTLPETVVKVLRDNNLA